MQSYGMHKVKQMFEFGFLLYQCVGNSVIDFEIDEDGVFIDKQL